MMIGGQGSAVLYRIPSPPPPSPDGRVSFISRAREETPPTSFFYSLPFTISHSAAERSCGIRWVGEGLQISFKDDFRHSLKLHSKVTLFICVWQENGSLKKFALLENHLVRLDLSCGLFGGFLNISVSENPNIVVCFDSMKQDIIAQDMWICLRMCGKPFF